MSSVDVLHTQNDSVSVDFNDYSLLTEIEVPSSNAPVEDVHHHRTDDFNFTNMQSALNETTSSDSNRETQLQISELIKENNQLKAMLEKNNSEMEKKLQTAKIKIAFLEELNSNMNKKISEMRVKATGPSQTCTKCTTLETGLTHMLGMDYIEENQHLLLEWSYFRENLTNNLRYLCEHLEEISKSKKTWEEKILFDSYCLMLKFKIAFLEGNKENPDNFLASIRTDEETGFEVIRLKCENPSAVIAALRQEVKDKDEELNYLRKQHWENEKLTEKETKLGQQECGTTLTSEYERLRDELKSESARSEQYKKRCENLEQQLKVFKTQLGEQSSGKKSDGKVIQELEKEIQDLKEFLKLEQEANKKDKKKLAEIMIKCEKFQVDYDRVTKLLEIQSKDEKEKKKELALKENDAKKYMEEADYLSAKLIEVEEQLKEKNTEIKKLEIQLADATEKNLHSSTQSKRSDQKQGHHEAAGIMLCPICSKGFSDVRAVENHVNRCLEENS